MWSNKVIYKLRKKEHQNPKFGHTQGEIKKKPPKKYISILLGVKLRKPSIFVKNWISSYLSFFMSASIITTYVFIAPICITTIIIFEPCALNVEFQHFILRFNEISLLCGYHWKMG
jgi:ABC-type lipoprotein release transport system permease subunit